MQQLSLQKDSRASFALTSQLWFVIFTLNCEQIRWKHSLLQVETIDLLLLYRVNIPFGMHCCSAISHIYFCFTVKLWGFTHAFLPENLHTPANWTQLFKLGSEATSSRAVQHTILKYINGQRGDARFYSPVVLLRVFPVKLWKPKTCKVPHLATYFGQKFSTTWHRSQKRKF